MSYYFEIKSKNNIDPTRILAALQDNTVKFVSDTDEDNPDATQSGVFESPGASTRGVVFQNLPNGEIEVGVNAFASEADIHLCRDVVEAAAALTDSLVEAESGEVVNASEVRDAFGDDWLSGRTREGLSLLNTVLSGELDEPGFVDGPITLFGVHHPYALTRNYLAQFGAVSPEELLPVVMQKFIDLQVLASTEDIFVPTVMQIELDTGTPAQIDAFIVPENVRTIAQNAAYAVIDPGADEGPRWLNTDLLRERARELGWCFYDAVHFEIPEDNGDAFEWMISMSQQEPHCHDETTEP